MMRAAILGFAEQLVYEPQIEQGPMAAYERVLVAGMGGSHLAADILMNLVPEQAVGVWSDYGLPVVSQAEVTKTLLIASSYSGNTEETIDAYETGRRRGLSGAVVAVGGKLIELAKRDGVPYVQLPNTGIQPRSALGFSLRALVCLLGREDLANEARGLAKVLQPERWEVEGKRLAETLCDRVPVVYASQRNVSVAYSWKIKMNETGKIPAFYNVVPELNHNEMTGFAAQGASKMLSERFAFVFVRDAEDQARNQRRMEVMARLYRERGLPVVELEMTGATRMERVFQSLLLADWTAVALATHYGLESEQVPMVEEFKQSL